MTVSYSFSVSKATFGGFARLLLCWRGSIYKSLVKEALIFCSVFMILQCALRHAIDQEEKISSLSVITFVNSLLDNNFIPFSFILGFFVSVVFQRWMSQASVLPWPDRVCHLIGSYVHGSDDRSRMIRRTLARYVILLQVLTLQTVSTSVKRRFPKTEHLLRAGVMTQEEFSVYEKTDFSFGKWWLPCHWFTSLSTRAKKEGRIKDSTLLFALNREMLDFRNSCAITIQYDLISVPLAYTQVATITTYLYALALLIGSQTIEAPDGLIFTADYYFPFVTIWKFFFCVGWLKVAQQLLNPYGEDDDDFELNWMLDRAINLAYMVVDQYHLMHPKVKKDVFWDEDEVILPQTAQSAKFMRNPELGSGFKLEIDEVQYLPMEELCESDCEEHTYKSESLKRKDSNSRHSSFIRKMFHSGISQSVRRKSQKTAAARSQSCKQGFPNPVFSTNDEKVITTNDGNSAPAVSIFPETKKSSLRKLIKKNSPSNKKNSIKMKSKSLSLKSKKSYSAEDQRADETSHKTPRANEVSNEEVEKSHDSDMITEINGQQINMDPDNDFESNPEDQILEDFMPAIPEETSRANSLDSIEFKPAPQKGGRLSSQIDRAYDVVKEASDVLQEISARASALERWRANEGKGYESCCSRENSSGEESSGDNPDGRQIYQRGESDKKEVALVIEDYPDQNEKRCCTSPNTKS